MGFSFDDSITVFYSATLPFGVLVVFILYNIYRLYRKYDIEFNIDMTEVEDEEDERIRNQRKKKKDKDNFSFTPTRTLQTYLTELLPELYQPTTELRQYYWRCLQRDHPIIAALYPKINGGTQKGTTAADDNSEDDDDKQYIQNRLIVKPIYYNTLHALEGSILSLCLFLLQSACFFFFLFYLYHNSTITNLDADRYCAQYTNHYDDCVTTANQASSLSTSFYHLCYWVGSQPNTTNVHSTHYFNLNNGTCQPIHYFTSLGNPPYYDNRIYDFSTIVSSHIHNYSNYHHRYDRTTNASYILTSYNISYALLMDSIFSTQSSVSLARRVSSSMNISLVMIMLTLCLSLSCYHLLFYPMIHSVIIFYQEYYHLNNKDDNLLDSIGAIAKSKQQSKQQSNGDSKVYPAADIELGRGGSTVAHRMLTVAQEYNDELDPAYLLNPYATTTTSADLTKDQHKKNKRETNKVVKTSSSSSSTWLKEKKSSLYNPRRATILRAARYYYLQTHYDYLPIPRMTQRLLLDIEHRYALVTIANPKRPHHHRENLEHLANGLTANKHGPSLTNALTKTINPLPVDPQQQYQIVNTSWMKRTSEPSYLGLSKIAYYPTWIRSWLLSTYLCGDSKKAWKLINLCGHNDVERIQEVLQATRVRARGYERLLTYWQQHIQHVQQAQQLSPSTPATTLNQQHHIDDYYQQELQQIHATTMTMRTLDLLINSLFFIEWFSGYHRLVFYQLLIEEPYLCDLRYYPESTFHQQWLGKLLYYPYVFYLQCFCGGAGSGADGERDGNIMDNTQSITNHVTKEMGSNTVDGQRTTLQVLLSTIYQVYTWSMIFACLILIILNLYVMLYLTPDLSYLLLFAGWLGCPLIYFLIILPIRIACLQILLPRLSYEKYMTLYKSFSKRIGYLLKRSSGFLPTKKLGSHKNYNSLIQVFHPICLLIRYSSPKYIRLPIGKILLSMHDFDLPYAHYSSLPFPRHRYRANAISTSDYLAIFAYETGSPLVRDCLDRFLYNIYVFLEKSYYYTTVYVIYFCRMICELLLLPHRSLRALLWDVIVLLIVLGIGGLGFWDSFFHYSNVGSTARAASYLMIGIILSASILLLFLSYVIYYTLILPIAVPTTRSDKDMTTKQPQKQEVNPEKDEERKEEQEGGKGVITNNSNDLILPSIKKKPTLAGHDKHDNGGEGDGAYSLNHLVYLDRKRKRKEEQIKKNKQLLVEKSNVHLV